MNEPFRESSKDEKILNKDGNPIPIFSASRFPNCDWNHYCDKTPRLTKPIKDELSIIFDDGIEVHEEEEYLRDGARNILEHEKYHRIVHESETWGVSGLLDYDKICFRYPYIEDLKSTKFGGFYFFLKEGIKTDNKIQMSIYAYLKYVCTGVQRKKGVITKIDKEEPLNRISLVTDLFLISEIRNFLVNNPVVLCILGKINEEQLIEACIQKMRPEVNKKTGEHWQCLNCQYATGDCPVRQGL